MARKPLQKIYQLKVTLHRSKPPIWRRLLVPSSIVLSDFHRVLQVVMGWDNEHMHQFIAKDDFYGDIDCDRDVIDESEVKLDKLLKNEKDGITYDYDFGDNWKHKIVLEEVLPFGSKTTLPHCAKGRRACPPEDIGGVCGYEEFLRIINDPNHPAHDESLERVAEDFDPEDFDLEGTNKDLDTYITI